MQVFSKNLDKPQSEEEFLIWKNSYDIKSAKWNIAYCQRRLKMLPGASSKYNEEIRVAKEELRKLREERKIAINKYLKES